MVKWRTLPRIALFILPFSIFFLGCGRAPVQEREVEFTEFRSSASTSTGGTEDGSGGGTLDLGGGNPDLGGPEGFCGCDGHPNAGPFPTGGCPTIGQKQTVSEWSASTCAPVEYPECSEWNGCYYDIYECECKEQPMLNDGEWVCTLVDMTIEPCRNTLDPWWKPL